MNAIMSKVRTSVKDQHDFRKPYNCSWYVHIDYPFASIFNHITIVGKNFFFGSLFAINLWPLKGSPFFYFHTSSLFLSNR